MARATQTGLVRDETSGTRLVAAVAVGVSAVLFGVAVGTLFGAVAIDRTLGGLSVVTLLGALLVGLGVAVVAFGLGSNAGWVETDPLPSAGMVSACAFSGIWFAVGGLVAAHVLGLGSFGWLGGAVLLGAGGFAATVMPAEDIGSTLPAGAFTALAGLVLLTGLVGPGWTWATGWTNSVTFQAGFVVPTLTLFCSLISGWAAAKAYGGFGARGRHMGAYLLVYLNAGLIIAVLFVLVAFTAFKGFPGLIEGVEIGWGAGPETTIALFGSGYTIVWPVSIPFLMNGVALLNDTNGVLPAIVGTVWLVVGAVVFAVPIGVGTAVFVTEYAGHGRFTQVVEVATNALWSTPSIVFGLFGLAFLVPRFGSGKSLLAGMVTLGFMLLPLVIITSREAMLAVPDEYRDASAALGVSKWQTVRSVVLPAALPGVITGVILGVGRIAGETAPILLTMAGAVAPAKSVDLIGGFRFVGTPPFVTNPELMRATSALPYQLYALITAGVGRSSNIADLDEFKWATAFVLLLVVLSFYAVGIATRYYFRKRIQHE